MTPATRNDVYSPLKRSAMKGLDHLAKASKIGDHRDKSRNLHMTEAANALRKAAYEIDNVLLAEQNQERDGFSLWQLSMTGEEVPVLV